MKLTDLKCKTTQPKEKSYRLSDGNGLYFEVHPNGSKYWRLRYRYLGKEKLQALGVYPEVSLSEARDKCIEAKKLLRDGIDPAQAKKETKRQAQIKAENDFKSVSLEWFETNKDKWSEGYQKKVMRVLNKNVYPFIGHRPISEITPPELLEECLRPMEKRGALYEAGRTRQLCGMVFRYGIQTGKCEWNAAENLKGATKTRKTKHFRAMDLSVLPKFLKALERNEARIFERTRRAVWLSLYTFARPGEIRQAQWQDINFDKKQWIIPAERIKMERDHIIPICPQVERIFQNQKQETGHINTPWVFPGQAKPKKPMSDGTVNKAIQRLGFKSDTVAHGFRALARTTIREELGYENEVIEKQLAHESKNPLGGAYDRTQFIKERTKMMHEWADYLDRLLNA